MVDHLVTLFDTLPTELISGVYSAQVFTGTLFEFLVCSTC